MTSNFARAVITAALFALLPILDATAVCAKPVVVITLTQATVVTAADGTVRLAPLDGSVGVPHGTVIRYTVRANDVGTDAAGTLTLSGHIPAGTTFVAGSVRGPGGRAEYSLDGSTFSARPMVEKETPAGKVQEPANPALYVMVRWIKDSPLPAASNVSFAYDVAVQ